MKVHVVTLVIIDFDEVGGKGAGEIIEEQKFPNRCIDPQVQSVNTYEIGEWEDTHPLNQHGTDAISWLQENADET